MKQLKQRLVWLCIAVGIFCSASALYSQVRIGVNLNIGDQPVWGPVGYDHVEYYYLPDIDVYYNVPNHVFFYYEDGRWRRRSELPPRWANYDLYHSYKVVVNERRPYLHADVYRARYHEFVGRRDQVVIRDSHDERYFVNKDHPEHGKWVEKHKGEGHDHGRHGDRD
ncbi:MAG TPA: hypothetical protein VKS81_05200 [Bacteroidota bacterium]|nr:hypothetical protein [Bacteroidota bacterium]